MDTKDKLLKYCSSIGLDKIGFCRCRIFKELEQYYQFKKDKGFFNEFEEKDIEKKINPFVYMKEGRTIISVAFPYNFINEDNPSKVAFSMYCQGEDYHRVISFYLEKVCSFIKELGGKAEFFVDSNSLPEVYIASLSGIGFIGKNNLLITKEYGSYIFLGEIITDLYLEENMKIQESCRECNLCLKACPTASITSNNHNTCLSYLTQKKELSLDEMIKIKGSLFGCDICQRVCPNNTDVKASNIKEFQPLDYMFSPDLEELINLDNRSFIKYKRSSCSWRGKNLLIRNALINYMLLYKEKLVFMEATKSPYIKHCYYRLLEILKL
ncbi:MAG TPA: tRNA epoxyqueuosine(34) reductase QueG [Clostridiaceae bacterium]